MTLVRPVAGSARSEKKSPDRLACLLALGRPIVMGVLNVTPDSFSDGGRFLDPVDAIDQARRMTAEGADVLDIGAESTRPYGGAVAVPIAEEMRRLGPVLPAVVGLGVPVSIDTMKAEVAAWALAAGAAIVNDVWGLQRDGELSRVVAEHAVPVIIMHNREAADPSIDIIADICAFFSRSLDIAARAGIARQSLTAIARLPELRSFGLPLLVGASRKRFIDKVSPAPPDQRLGGSIAAHVLAVMGGAAIVRTHDVPETLQALRVAAAIRSAL